MSVDNWMVSFFTSPMIISLNAELVLAEVDMHRSRLIYGTIKKRMNNRISYGEVKLNRTKTNDIQALSNNDRVITLLGIYK